MLQSKKILFYEISKLPVEKIGKAISFIRYLSQEAEDELFLDEDEEIELHNLLNSSDFVSSKDMLAKIEELPND